MFSRQRWETSPIIPGHLGPSQSGMSGTGSFCIYQLALMSIPRVIWYPHSGCLCAKWRSLDGHLLDGSFAAVEELPMASTESEYALRAMDGSD